MKRLSFENSEVLRSQIEIPSIKTATTQLILNAIDANATSISVVLDNFNISVSDNGEGFNPLDLQKLKRNCI
jgi:DNA mismatch repair ATPase MutL